MRKGEGSVSVSDDRALRQVDPRAVFDVGSIILNNEVVGGEVCVGFPGRDKVARVGVDASSEIRRLGESEGAAKCDGLSILVGIGREDFVVVI